MQMIITPTQVYQRLQKLGLCLAHSRTIKLIDTLGENFDSLVQRWKTAAEYTFVNTDLGVRVQDSNCYHYHNYIYFRLMDTSLLMLTNHVRYFHQDLPPLLTLVMNLICKI